MNKEKARKNLSIAFFGVATITVCLLSYMLSYICFNLYRIDCKEEFAAIIIGKGQFQDLFIA